MKLILVYGSAINAINQKIINIKGEFDAMSIKEVDAKNQMDAEIFVEIATPSLFSDTRLVLINNLDENIALDKFPKDDSLTVVIKKDKTVSKASKLYKSALELSAQIVYLGEEEEVSVFPFLDMLAERNPNAFAKLNILEKEYGSQYILTMIFYMLRKFVVQPVNLPSFVMKKLKAQKENLPLEKIEEFYSYILSIDYKIKMGIVDEKSGLFSIVNKFIV